MSGSVVVRPEQFEKAVMKALAEYGDKTTEMLESVTKSNARQTASALKGAGLPGRDAEWSHKAQKGGAFKLSETVYNRTAPQLTHLLEKPHSTGGGGQYPKKVNYTGQIARVEEEYTNKYMEEVLSKL